VGFAAITLCVASQRVFIVVYFVIDSVRKLSDTPSHHKKVNLINIRMDICEFCIISFINDT
jgi:hypothetical protein